MRKGQFIYHARSGKKVKVPRLVRMHSNEMEDIQEIGPGEICAIFGIDCASGDTFTDGSTSFSMTNMFVPEPVISLALKPVGAETPNFSRALNRFQKEDPTFRVHIDKESKETIISGMGELHLEIYVERMKREYNVECTTGKPRVAFRETITQRADFFYTHKKQSGGAGQYARVIGFVEPMAMDEETGKDTEFVNQVMGGNIPSNYIPACEKGFFEALEKGSLSGNAVCGARLVLNDGLAHSVDSSELAFRLAVIGAFREVYNAARPIILEPIMTVEVVAPSEFQSAVIGGINQRRGTIMDSEVREDEFTCVAEVALNDMFGYSNHLRGITQGKGEFSMEYKTHQPVMPQVQAELETAYKKTLGQPKRECETGSVVGALQSPVQGALYAVWNSREAIPRACPRGGDGRTDAGYPREEPARPALRCKSREVKNAHGAARNSQEKVSTARVLESPRPAGPHLARPYVRRMDLAARGEQTNAAHGVGYTHNFPRALNALRAATARLADGGDFLCGLQDRPTTSLAPRARRPCEAMPKVSGFRDSEPIEDSHRSRLTSVKLGAARLPHSDP
ncbi:hypothetical protein VTO73DRAFT_6267 [Trametes versicolor]